MKLLYFFLMVLLFFAVLSIVIFQGGETRYFADLNDLYSSVISFGYDVNIVIDEANAIFETINEIDRLGSTVFIDFEEEFDPSNIGGSTHAILAWIFDLFRAPILAINYIYQLLFLIGDLIVTMGIDASVFIYKLLGLVFEMLIPSKYT